MSGFISDNLQRTRAKVDELAKDLHELTIRTGNEALANTVSDLRNRIHEPFMFVIVGEVKAGKSSFINALLETGREITKVAPQPMTDTILQILYGEPEESISVNPYLKKILLPVPILQEIAIVDTPGTNTIIQHHQEITERFIPASDLIVFVFEAKNPYRQSAWDFFDYIHTDWHKKIIFVLQQKDLMPDDDLAVNLQGVRDYATKKGIVEPQVFAVSAKLEQEKRREESGFLPLRDYIRAHITNGRAPILKLQNNVATCANINARIRQALDIRQEQFQADTVFRQEIVQTLDNQELKSLKQVDVLTENIVAAYERITRTKEQELSTGLSFFSMLRRSFSAIFSKKTSIQEWLQQLALDLEQQLHSELRSKLDAGVADLADNIQQMARLIELKIRSNKSILDREQDLFRDITEQRGRIMQELQETFNRFMEHGEGFTDSTLFPDKTSISPTIATGSGLAVVGIVLAAVTQNMIFDITGGVLTTIGLLFAGISGSVKRRQIMHSFRQEVNHGKNRLETEVSSKLKTYIRQLKNKIDGNFQNFDAMLTHEAEQLQQLENRYRAVTASIEHINNELGPT